MHGEIIFAFLDGCFGPSRVRGRYTWLSTGLQGAAYPHPLAVFDGCQVSRTPMVDYR
jgi:hypothetical protein